MFDDLKNNIDFFIRSNTKFTRKNFVEKNEKILFRNYLENLYTFDLLAQNFKLYSTSNLRVLDIGCKNFFYAQGEYQFFKTFSIDVKLDGIELDAYRLYSNLYSRYETAKFFIKGNNNIRYIADNLLNLNNIEYDCIVWFLPFVKIEPLQYWGLPKKYFLPEKLLHHAYSLLKENGQMLIVNQGVEEAQLQKNLLDRLNIKYIDKGIVKSEFLEYKNDRYAFLIIK